MRSVSPTNGFLVTVDVEDHAIEGARRRFAEALEPLLDRLRLSQMRATFFVVGSLASHWSTEIKELAAEGHEIGLHGYTHQFVDRIGPTGFAEDIARGVGELGDMLGRHPSGYRAPYFSITRRTPWAPDLLTNAGFVYSSSVLPVWNPQAGLPGAPRTPFRWSSGLVEFPAPVLGFGPLGLPALGGAYLRLLPRPIVRWAASVSNVPGGWTYAHPYDFDTDEPFTRLEGQQWWVTRLLFARRSQMLPRVMSLADRSARTFGELAQDPAFSGGLPSFATPPSGAHN